ncbi:MAG: hypothetical protein IJT18_04990, partial [Oscillospiraceae bacterium]|nr:hypothetical protein [Oscillospiraceae bacterium]
MYVAEMRKSLAATPELLPELKEAGVVDSGAMGYIEIVDGMLKYLYGEILEDKPVEIPPPQEADLSLFDENSAFTDGYCMEFILQRMNGDAYDAAFRLPAFIAALEKMGGSIAAVENGRRVKVHVHTHRPEAIIALCRRYGEFLTFKLENMQVQHNERDAAVVSSRGHKPLAVVSVVSGQGMRELFTGVGCDELLEGGATMNASAQDFVSALGRADADTVVLLPNDKNTLLAAKQAVTLSRAENVVILPTRSMVEGYFALAMDVPDSTDVEYRLRQMRLGAKNVLTLSAAVATKDSAYHGVRCRAGDRVAFLGGEPAAVGCDWQSAVLAALAGAEGLSDRESCIIFRGRDASESEAEALAAAIGEKYPHLEVETLYGGQSVYAWLIGIV